MRFRLHLFAIAVISLSAGCGPSERRAPVLGEAFIGPTTVELRDELAPAAKVVGKAHHGDRVEIIQTRRRFVKVRTPGGEEGWTDSRKLLTSEQMEELRHLSERASKLPAMGSATPFDVLNMHAEPNRHSASFYQLTPGMQVQALVRRATERTPPPPPEPIIKRAPPKPRAAKKKEVKEARIPPPPKPAAPGLPAEWLQLSKTNLPPDPAAEAAKKKEAPPPPPRIDDWTLVRTKDGKAGWVLSRMLVMSIPDEVAQYSEGARITAYFPLGEVFDEEQGVSKKHWLWTTVRGGASDFDFDSFRVFIWNKRRHRYETSYIERDLQGFHPVQVEGPKFTVLLRNEDGGFYTKTFVLEGYLTRWLGNAPAAPPPDPLAGLMVPKAPGRSNQPPPEAEKSFTDRLKDRISGMFKRS